MSKRYAYILLTDEKWWNRRCSQNRAGKKLHAFVRRGTVGPKNAELIFFYVKHPLKEIRGFGEFVERVKGDVDELWNKHGHETVFESYEEYMDFMQGRTKATFIRFKNLRLLSAPKSLKDISQITGIERMSRNGRYINEETARELI
ncbi:MAG: hypothetical protein ACE5OW_01420 [Candidatus Bathyarchaeia archaeon]